MSDISAEVRQRIQQQAGNRCGYCLSHQRYVMGKLEIEHIYPKAEGGLDDEENLWLACGLCNRYKRFQTEGFDDVTESFVSLFNPRQQIWSEHFAWDNSGVRIVGITPVGRATVKALKMNNEIAVEVRANWVLAGWHPPEDE